jgi:hypothetical protein
VGLEFGIVEGKGDNATSTRPAVVASLKGDPRVEPGQRPVDRETEQAQIWETVAYSLGMSQSGFLAMRARTRAIGSSLPAELVTKPDVSEAEFYRAVGASIGIAVSFRLEANRLHLNARQAADRLGGKGDCLPVRYVGDDGATIYVISPEPANLSKMVADVLERPGISARLVLVPRSIMRAALVEIAQPALITKGRDRLFLSSPLLSARTLANGWQGALLGAVAIGIPLGVAVQPGTTVLLIHLIATLFFFGVVAVRLAAIRLHPRRRPRRMAANPAPFPTYTILVALRDEAVHRTGASCVAGHGFGGQASRGLEVKAGVRKRTIARRSMRSRRVDFASWIEVVEVPNGMLKTKPNALCYRLAADIRRIRRPVRRRRSTAPPSAA